MTGPHPETESSGNRQISVAELLARQGSPAPRPDGAGGDAAIVTPSRSPS